MSVKKYSIFLFILFFLFTYSQNNKLESLSFQEIEKKIDSLAFSNNKNAFPIIKFYISKSKKENNPEALIYAYRYATKASESEIEARKYADSAIIIAKKNQNFKLLSESFLNKGVYLMDIFKNREALDNILIANKYASLLKDAYIEHKTLYYISQNKILLGQDIAAIQDLTKCLIYFENNLGNSNLGEDYEIYFTYSLMTIIDCNSRLGYTNQNIKLLNKAFQYINETKKTYLLPYFISCQGVDYFYSKKYSLAIKHLEKALYLYNDVWPHHTEVFYLGLSYWKKGEKFKAVKLFKKLDNTYKDEKNKDPKFRPAYELLIEYYKEKNNKKKQLEYINKLMALDDSYEKNYKYLFSKIHKEYDTNKLIQEKNEIQNSFKIYRYITIALIIVFISIVSVIGYKFYSTQKKIKKINSKKIVLTPEENEKIIDLEILNKNFSQDYYEKIPGLKADTVKNILNNLDNFEKNLGFLDAQLTQLSLSEKLETNASYLSKIFKAYKEKNYNVYIGDLRITYIINLLSTDKKNWEKDIKELANLGGFSNAENFSDHFKRKIGSTPSQYIKSLRKEDNF